MKRIILVITASKALRFLLQTVLQDKFKIIAATDASDAMFWLSRSNVPAAIVIDPELPDTEPWEMVEYFKSSGLYDNIPLVVISSLPEQELKIRCKNYAVNAFFTKPFNPIDLLNELENHLGEVRPLKKGLLKVV
ncbi:response regulator [Flavihumibacter rivuli]|uniref:response regulator n=1 Tax=Flavihumibacter rivuli TaxID=2838156 RepID=UPI001BDE0B0F|nr:response regulator [Flavihumibacter rivuli]ULQ58294.1 response regulator [Flavihumibacter rivuli]